MFDCETLDGICDAYLADGLGVIKGRPFFGDVKEYLSIRKEMCNIKRSHFGVDGVGLLGSEFIATYMSFPRKL